MFPNWMMRNCSVYCTVKLQGIADYDDGVEVFAVGNACIIGESNPIWSGTIKSDLRLIQ